MYTYLKDTDGVKVLHSIIDPDGVHIANVETKEQADALLSHLNR
jgi:hypothetical protein